MTEGEEKDLLDALVNITNTQQLVSNTLNSIVAMIQNQEARIAMLESQLRIKGKKK